MTHYIRIFLFIYVLIPGSFLSAQIPISGLITDTNKKAIPYINILFYEPGSSITVAFAVSNQQGIFNALINSDSDSLDLKLSSVHYRNEIRRIANKSQELIFNLEPELMELESITVNAAPIEQTGDTIVYLINSFAKQEDRSIEDVLKRMPGIEIEPGGRILYQGLPLQNFYVEGLDLMDGRYVVVSKNLPQTSVGSIEILENHQPVRILEDKIASNQASLNIKLKHNIAATGTAKLGAGLSPFLWEVNVTPMAFMKDFQLLCSYQTNNVGNEVSLQLRQNTFQELLLRDERPVDNPIILDIQPLIPPEIEKNRYMDNNIHLLNMNGLMRLSNDLQLRINMFYVNDIQKQENKVEHTHFTPDDTISYLEHYQNQKFDNYLHGEFTLNRNVKENFLNNELKFQIRWDQILSDVINENKRINQDLDNPFRSLSNNFSSINPVGKYLLEFTSYVSLDNSPHNLSVVPGQFEYALNDSLPYDESLQLIQLQRFFTDNSARIVYNWNNFNFTPKLGFSYRDQLLKSGISVVNNDSIHDPGSHFANYTLGKHLRLFAQTGVEYKKRNLIITANLPFSWQNMKLEDNKLEEKQEFRGVLFDPTISLTYKIKGFWKARVAWSYRNRLGDMDKINYAYILKNYRILSQNNAPISHTRRNNYSLYISYRNPIISFFNTLSYVYSQSDNNLLYSSIILNDGTSVFQAYFMPNKAYYHSLQFQTSKFISKTKTNISFRAAFNQRDGSALLNKQIFGTTTIFYNLAPEINLTITRWLNVEYGLHTHFIKTFLAEDKKSDICTIKHLFDLFSYPLKNHMLSLSAEYYYLNNSNNYFLDFLYRFTLKKQKLDFELRWNNIFNNDTYTSYFANSYTITESVYYLRPSQILFSIKFNY